MLKTISTIEVRLAECHDTCLDVIGPGNHTANVNPIADIFPQLWRIDCDDCGTCVQSGLNTKAEARKAAMDHVRMSPDEYWELRSEGLI